METLLPPVTPPQASVEIGKKLTGMVLEPNVSVSLLSKRAATVSVVGEVQSSGSYELRPGEDLVGGTFPRLADRGKLNCYRHTGNWIGVDTFKERQFVEDLYLNGNPFWAVWKRDGGKRTFVSDTGVRCSSRRLIEFDHVTEVARGGVATTSTIRLRCQALLHVGFCQRSKHLRSR